MEFNLIDVSRGNTTFTIGEISFRINVDYTNSSVVCP